jgi:hypothetical protein
VSDFLGAITPGALATVQGLIVSSIAVLVLLVGFCVLLNLPKLRASGPHSKVVRSLDEVVGTARPYLAPDAPHGPVDQLRTPELLEAEARKTA